MKRNALMIGSFVVAAFVIITASVLWLSGSDLFSRQQKASVIYEGNVSGLSIGSPVTFRGVTIGQVTEIGLKMDPASLKTTVPVSLKLQPSAMGSGEGGDRPLDVPALVARGLRARLVSQSVVTGQKGVELDFAPNTPALLHGVSADPEIPALADKFGALIDQVADLPLRETVGDVRNAVGELRMTLVSVRQTLDGVQSLLAGTSKELQGTVARSRQTLIAATSAIQQVQASSTVTLASITRLTDTTQQTVLAAQPELQRTLVGAREASESAKVAMTRVADIAAPGAPLRSDLEGAVRDLSQAARGLRSLSELLEEKPNALIFGNPQP